MKLEIKKIKNKRDTNPHYIATVNFMEGDADGYQQESIKFKENEIEHLKKFIFAMSCCCKAYPNGRGGNDEYNGLPEYDAYCNEDAAFDETMKALNPGEVFIDHPTDSSYISTSFESVDITYIDKNGDEFSVGIEFNKEEKQRLAECANFFK